MRFHLFVLPTAGARPELEHGLAGQRDDLYQRTGLTPVEDVLRGLELFAERVMPRFA